MRIAKLTAGGAILVAALTLPASAADECTSEMIEVKGKKLDELVLKNPRLAERVPEVAAEVEKEYGGEPPEEKRCEAMDKLIAGLEKIEALPGTVDQAPSEPCTPEKVAELGNTLETFISENPDMADEGEGVFAEVEKKYGGEPPEDKICAALGEVISALSALKDERSGDTSTSESESKGTESDDGMGTSSAKGDCDEASRQTRQAALGEYLKANPEKTSKIQDAVATVEADYGGEPPLDEQCEALDKLLTILKED